MRGHIALELFGVDRAAGLEEVVDRPVGREAETEPDVAELEVEVDESYRPAPGREAHREVRRDERLTGAALRAQHGHERSGRKTAGSGGARLARHRLLQGELDAVLRLRQHYDVIGADLEDAPNEPVRRALGEDDHRTAGPLASGSLDQVERPVRVPRGRH